MRIFRRIYYYLWAKFSKIGRWSNREIYHLRKFLKYLNKLEIDRFSADSYHGYKIIAEKVEE